MVSYHSSPDRWCAVYLIRYATGSIFPSSITIFIRSVASPSENRPFFILSNKTSDSSMGRSLQGDGGALWPFSSSPFWWHTYAWPLNEDKESTQTSLTGFEQIYKRKQKRILDLPANKIHSEVVELLEVVWCMRDSIRFVACVIQKSWLETHLCEYQLSSDQQQKQVQLTKPLHHVLDSREVFFLLLLWVCVVVSQETNSIVCLQEETDFTENSCRED